MKFLARLLLLAVLTFGIGLDMTVAAEDVDDLHAISLAESGQSTASGHDIDGAGEGDLELTPGTAPIRCIGRIRRTVAAPADRVLPPPDLPHARRPPIGPAFA